MLAIKGVSLNEVQKNETWKRRSHLRGRSWQDVAGSWKRIKRVIMIQFLKGCSPKDEQEILERLEPDFKVFRFEKSNTFFEELSEEEKAEELINIRNGFNFARKVAATGECDVLILDEVLGIIDQNIITLEDVEKLLEAKEEDLNLVMTGKVFPEKLKPYVDAISRIEYIQDLQD